MTDQPIDLQTLFVVVMKKYGPLTIDRSDFAVLSEANKDYQLAIDPIGESTLKVWVEEVEDES